MAGFLQPDDGLTWTDQHGREETTLTDSQKIDALEAEVLRLGAIVRKLEPLVSQVGALERQFRDRDSAARNAAARYGL